VPAKRRPLVTTWVALAQEQAKLKRIGEADAPELGGCREAIVVLPVSRARRKRP
jgi:hypothetical protein